MAIRAVLLWTIFCTTLAAAAPATTQSAKGTETARFLHFYDATWLDQYDRVGNRSPKWDDRVHRGLKEMVESFTSRDPRDLLAHARTAQGLLEAAIAQGCDDGAVLYGTAMLNERLGFYPRAAEQYRAGLASLKKSQYPPTRLIYATYRSAAADYRWQGVPEAVTEVMVDRAIDLLPAVANDPVVPDRIVMDLSADLLDLRKQVTGDRKPGMDLVEAQLAKAIPADGHVMHLVRGKFYVEYAWDLGQRGWNNQPAPVRPEDMPQEFHDRMKLAEAELTKAWQADPTQPIAPELMLAVVTAEGRPRGEMETWYQRAMEADPGCVRAASAKMTYLDPRWHGSAEETLQFGRELYKAGDWANGLPHLLFRAHEKLASGFDATSGANPMADARYWKRSRVWDDLRPFFEDALDEKHQTREASTVGWRTAYALVAFHSGHFAEASRQFDLLNGRFDPTYIRSQAEFDRLKQHAARQAADAGKL